MTKFVFVWIVHCDNIQNFLFWELLKVCESVTFWLFYQKLFVIYITNYFCEGWYKLLNWNY
jgi:hypothetical protein